MPSRISPPPRNGLTASSRHPAIRGVENPSRLSRPPRDGMAASASPTKEDQPRAPQSPNRTLRLSVLRAISAPPAPPAISGHPNPPGFGYRPKPHSKFRPL